MKYLPNIIVYKVKDININDLSYEEKQELINDIKIKTGIKFGYVNKYNYIIECDSYEKLRLNLNIASQCGQQIKLVIQ